MPVTMGVRKPTPPLILAMPWSSISKPRASRSTSLPKSSMVAASNSRRHSIKRIGVISDTHGVLRDEALKALHDSELIVHAGDIGAPEVLVRLREIALVFAVRGNNDRAEWAQTLPLTEAVEVGDHSIYLLHDISQLDIDPAAARFSA